MMGKIRGLRAMVVAATAVAVAGAGSSCVIASLDVASVSGRKVVLRANAATSTIREKYVVNIWY